MAKVYLICCRDVGNDCDFEVHGGSLDEVIELCTEHGRVVHELSSFGRELYIKMRMCIQVSEGMPSQEGNS